MFIVLFLFLTIIFYFVFSSRKEHKKFFKALFLIFLSASLLLAVFSCFQGTYISRNFLNVNSLVTFDEDDYATNHFVNLYLNTENQKLYDIENFHGIYLFKEVALAEDVEPIIVNNKNLSSYKSNTPLFIYSNEEGK